MNEKFFYTISDNGIHSKPFSTLLGVECAFSAMKTELQSRKTLISIKVDKPTRFCFVHEKKRVMWEIVKHVSTTCNISIKV
jgi:hypothetical protein